MAKIFITSMKGLNSKASVPQIASLDGATTETEVVGVVVESTAIVKGFKIARIHSDTDCYITYSASGVAPDDPTVNDVKILAGLVEYFEIHEGGIFKIWDGVTP